jgi:hypothetical protein
MWFLAVKHLLQILIAVVFMQAATSSGVLPLLEARATVPAPIVIPVSQDW